MKFAALGRTNWCYDSIIKCVEAGHECVAIGTGKVSPEYSVGIREYEELAKHYGCDFFTTDEVKTKDIPERLRDSGAEVAVSVNWLALIRDPVLKFFKYGVLNAHCGDLPRYRGNACPNWAIIKGEKRIGVTVHEMTEDLDAGPVYLKRFIDVTDETTIGDVYDFMSEQIPLMFRDVLDGLDAGSIKSVEQPADPALSLRCFPRRPEDSQLIWDSSALMLSRVVRASSEPFSGAFCQCNGEKMVVWKAHHESIPYQWHGVSGQVVEIRSDGAVAVLCNDGLLVLEEVELGKSGRTAPATLIKSTRTRLY